jgi:hypothetical protein
LFASSHPSIASETLDTVDMRDNTRRNPRMCVRKARVCGGNVEIIAVDLLVSVFIFISRPNHSGTSSYHVGLPRFQTCPSSGIIENTQGHCVSEIRLRLALFKAAP